MRNPSLPPGLLVANLQAHAAAETAAIDAYRAQVAQNMALRSSAAFAGRNRQPQSVVSPPGRPPVTSYVAPTGARPITGTPPNPSIRSTGSIGPTGLLMPGPGQRRA